MLKDTSVYLTCVGSVSSKVRRHDAIGRAHTYITGTTGPVAKEGRENRPINKHTKPWFLQADAVSLSCTTYERRNKMSV